MEKGGGHDFLCKVILLGEPDIGKTSLLTRYCDDTFSDQRQMTASFDNKIKKVNISNKTVALQLVDTAGQEKFRAVTSSFFRGVAGVVLVYDITNQTSFDQIPYWLSQLSMYARGVKSISLVGNKSDLDAQRVVSQNAAMDLAKQHNIENYYETSAKTGDNVDTVFMELTQHMLKDKLSGESKEGGPPSPQGSYTTSTSSQPPVDLQASSAPKKKKRCMV